MNELIVHKTANKLNKLWDNLANSYFQKKELLLHCEKYNQCNQRYYELYDKELISGAVVYNLPINILTYAKNSFKVKTNVIGVPASVSSSGVLGDKKVISYVKLSEKGFTLGLNLREDNPKFSSGKTLPTVVLENRFKNWKEYLDSLRATYRRRIKKVTSKLDHMNVESTDCSRFNDKMHKLYLNVYNKSESKLEKLTMEFFKNLPGKFLLTTFSMGKDVVGWHILVEDDKKLFFFLGGVDYQYNEEYNIYHNMLIDILKKGIDRKVELIDFGQTAEEAKCRLGGVIEDRSMFAWHTNKILNFLINKFKSRLDYKYAVPKMQVFK